MKGNQRIQVDFQKSNDFKWRGSMGRGGARVGAGRKRQTGPFAVVPRGDAVASEGNVGLIAPNDLGLAEREFWGAYAADAIAARTLTPRTIPAWRLLCEVSARKGRTARLLEKAEALTDQDGRLYLDSLVKLSRVYAVLTMRTESLMARFGLAPMGKAVEGARGARVKPNPWEAVAGK
jgi:hypothetical protein